MNRKDCRGWGHAFLWFPALLLVSSEATGQYLQMRPIDLGSAIKTQTIRVTISPPYSGDTLKPFDGNPLTSIALEQNFPNPFNPTTAISYHLPAGQAGIPAFSLVTLKVFDVLGREIATLVSEGQKPGSYRMVWNASGFPSGVYFYRLQSGGFAETKKMILIR